MGAVCCLILARHAASLLGCKGAISTLSFRRRPDERQSWRGLAPDYSATAALQVCALNRFAFKYLRDSRLFGPAAVQYVAGSLHI